MRTFRLIEMTLLMVLCAVNFTACSDDEDEHCWYMDRWRSWLQL